MHKVFTFKEQIRKDGGNNYERHCINFIYLFIEPCWM